MRRTFRIAALLALLPVIGAGAPAEPARKEWLEVAVRADARSAARFTVESEGFRVMPRRGRPVGDVGRASDTLTVFGAGVVKLVSAEPGKLLSVDVWMVARERSAPARYTGRIIRIERDSPGTPYRVTTP